MKIQVAVFWFVTPSSDNQREVTRLSETLMS